MKWKFRPHFEPLGARDLPSANPLDPPTPPPDNPSWWTTAAGPMTPEEWDAYNECMGSPAIAYTPPDFTDTDPNAWRNKPTEDYTAADWVAYNDFMMNPGSPPDAPDDSDYPVLGMRSILVGEEAVIEEGNFGVDTSGTIDVPEGCAEFTPCDEPVVPTADTLKWSDFKRIAERKKPGIDAETAMTLSAKVDYTPKYQSKREAGNDIEYVLTIDKIDSKKFTSTFSAEDSYYVGEANMGEAGARLLKHEQLHLRLGAYIAEKAAANFPEAEFKNLKVTFKISKADSADAVKLKAAENKALDEMDKFVETFIAKYRSEKWKKIDDAVHEVGEESYDEQTSHGSLPDKQRDWEDNWKAKTDAILKKNGWDK